MPKKQLGKAKPRKWKLKTATSIAIKFQEASDRAQCRYEQMTKDLFDSRQHVARLIEERDHWAHLSSESDRERDEFVAKNAELAIQAVNALGSAASWEATAKTSEIAEAIWKSTHEDEEQYGKELELFIAALCRNLEIANERFAMLTENVAFRFLADAVQQCAYEVRKSMKKSIGGITMPKRTKDYHSWLLKRLVEPREAQRYLRVAMEDSPEAFLVALRNVAEARSMTKVAEEADVNRENLYRVLSKDGNPRWDTINSVLKAVGMTLLPTNNQTSLPPAR